MLNFTRDWCKKKRTGLDLAMKMDAFSIFWPEWLPLQSNELTNLPRSSINLIYIPQGTQEYLRIKRTPWTKVYGFYVRPLSFKWFVAPKLLKIVLYFIKNDQSTDILTFLTPEVHEMRGSQLSSVADTGCLNTKCVFHFDYGNDTISN